NYVGPDLVFGMDEDGADGLREPLPLIRHVNQVSECWIVEGHKKEYIPQCDDEERIPPSLEEAIVSFALVCAARAARGQARHHNSMLVHVSRFKGVHQRVYDQVLEFVTDLKRALKYRIDDARLRNRLRELWDDDFMPTSAEVRARLPGWELRETNWS